MPTPLIIDTDMAFDDWLAILYLLSSQVVHVRAITIAATGEAHGDPAVKNALRLAALTSARAAAVACGRPKPLRGDHAFPRPVRTAMNARLGLSLPKPRYRPAPGTAVELLKFLLTSAAEPVTIVAIGPLTNLGEALSAEPALAKKIGMIYVMGGALNVPGNLGELSFRSDNPYAEWNFYIDPYAAELVLRSGAPITLVPLDVTNQVPVTMEICERCAAMQDKPAAQFVDRALRRVRQLARGRTIYFWDPLTAVLATHPEIGQYETKLLRVIQEEGRECGRLIECADGATVRVCTGVDKVAFEETFLNALNGAN